MTASVHAGRRATVGRSELSGDPDGVLKVYLTSRWAGEFEVESGQSVRLRAGPVEGVARLLVTAAGAMEPEPVLRMDGLLRQSMRVGIGSEVTLEPDADLPIAAEIRLRPPVDLVGDHAFASSIRQRLSEREAVAFVGALMWIELATHHGASMVFQVAEIDGGGHALARIGPATEVVIVEPDDDFAQSADVSLDDVGGLDDVIAELTQIVQYPLLHPGVFRWLNLPPPRGVILHGPPGTGKTLLSRALARDLGVEFYFVNAPELVGSGYGETEGRIRRLFAEAAHHAPAIICIDEIDAIAGQRSELASNSDLRAVSQLLTLMDGLRRVDGVVVLATTNRLEAVDPAFRRAGRFDRELLVGPPSLSGRRRIIDIYVRDLPLDRVSRHYLDELARATNGYVGADLMELVREAVFASLRRRGALERVKGRYDLQVSADDLEMARSRVRPSAARYAFVVQPSEAPHGSGLDAEFTKLAALASAVFEGRPGARAIGGAILTGPSGTGKTSLVHSVARSHDVPIVLLSGGQVYSRWLGASEDAIRQIFDRARRIAPAVLLIESLESLAPPLSSDTDNSAVARVVSQLQAELDESPAAHRVLVVATATSAHGVEPGLLRPGRLGLKVAVALPTSAQRLEMIVRFAEEFAIGLQREALDWLVEATAGMPAATVRGILAAVQIFNPSGPTVSVDDLSVAVRSLDGEAEAAKPL